MTRKTFILNILIILTLPLSLPLILTGCFSIPITSISKKYRSDHYDGKRFFHPKYQAKAKGFLEVMQWRWNRVVPKWPDVPITTDTPPPSVSGDQLRISYVGHATVLVQTQGLNLLFDPIWHHYPAPVSFTSIERVSQPGIDLENLPQLDAIFISHNHYDHLCIHTLKKLQKKAKRIITPLGNKSIINHGIKDHTYKITQLDWGQKVHFNDKFDAFLEPALHWSARGLSDRNKCLWGSFVLKHHQGENIYFAGDTGFGPEDDPGFHFKEIQEKYNQFRFSMLPVGAYEPRWFMKQQHMNPSEAVQSAELLQSKYNLGIHLQTFKNLTDETYDGPVQELNKALQESSISPDHFRTFKAGTHWNIPTIS